MVTITAPAKRPSLAITDSENPYRDLQAGKRILEEVFKIIGKTPIGRAALQSLRMHAVTIAFDESKSACLHAHHPDYGHQLFLGARKPVETNGRVSFHDPKILGYYARNIIHEMIHAEQKESFLSVPEDLRKKCPILDYLNQYGKTTYTFDLKDKNIQTAETAEQFVKHSLFDEAESVFGEFIFHEQCRRILPEYQKIAAGALYKETQFPENLQHHAALALHNPKNCSYGQVILECYSGAFDVLAKEILDSDSQNPSVQRWRAAYTKEFTTRQHRHESKAVPLEDHAAFSLPKVTLNSTSLINQLTGHVPEKPKLLGPPGRQNITPVSEPEAPPVISNAPIRLESDQRKFAGSPKNQAFWQLGKTLLPYLAHQDTKSYRTMMSMLIGLSPFSDKRIDQSLQQCRNAIYEDIIDVMGITGPDYAENALNAIQSNQSAEEISESIKTLQAYKMHKYQIVENIVAKTV